MAGIENKKEEKLDNDFENFKKEIAEMASILLELSVDGYMQMKCILLADAAVYCLPGTMELLKDLFEYADKHRPLLLEMR